MTPALSARRCASPGHGGSREIYFTSEPRLLTGSLIALLWLAAIVAVVAGGWFIANDLAAQQPGPAAFVVPQRAANES